MYLYRVIIKIGNTEYCQWNVVAKDLEGAYTKAHAKLADRKGEKLRISSIIELLAIDFR